MSQISLCSLWCLKAVNPGLKSIISSAYSWQYFPCIWNWPHQYICSEMHSENTMKDWCCLSNPLHYMYHESIKKHFKYQTSLRLEMSFRFESNLNQNWIGFELDLEGTRNNHLIVHFFPNMCVVPYISNILLFSEALECTWDICISWWQAKDQVFRGNVRNFHLQPVRFENGQSWVKKYNIICLVMPIFSLCFELPSSLHLFRNAFRKYHDRLVLSSQSLAWKHQRYVSNIRLHQDLKWISDLN